MEKIIIIGGVAAGAKVAAKSRRLLPDAEIEVFTDDAHVSYSACGLPYFIEGNFDDYRMLLVRSPQEFEEKGIHIHLRHRVSKINTQKHQILVNDLSSGKEQIVNYTKLVIATGASPIVPPIKNVQLKNVFTLRTIEDGINLKNQVLKSKNAVIVGGGYIGIELLEAFVKQGLNVTMVEFAPHIMSIFDNEISELIKEQILKIHGDKVKIINSDAVSELIGNDEVQKVITKNGLEIETDLVVLATGVRPNTEIATNAGIELGETKAIKVNQYMQTNIENIYACGDCAEKTNMVSQRPTWVPLGSTANKEGRVAAINLCGGKEAFEGILGSAVTKYYGMTMSLTGLTEKQAIKDGFEAISVITTKKDKVGYMPEAKNITIKLIADKKTRLLLGSQAIGCGDADKRVNTVASALVGKMTADDFMKNDLTYAPPFSTAIDPLLTATENLIKKLNS